MSGSRCSPFRSGTPGYVAARVAAVGLVALVAVALCCLPGPLRGGVLMLLPALLLAIVMLVRPYAGERLIARMSAARAHAAHDDPDAPRPRVRPWPQVARGGRLIAVSLAGRGPPAASRTVLQAA